MSEQTQIIYGGVRRCRNPEHTDCEASRDDCVVGLVGTYPVPAARELTGDEKPEAGWAAVTTPSPDLVDFIRIQIDTDERLARAVPDHRQRRGEFRWRWSERRTVGNDCGKLVAQTELVEQAEHIANFDPARALAEVESKRLLLEEIQSDLSDDPTDETAQYRARVLALPYRDREGYRQEWRP